AGLLRGRNRRRDRARRRDPPPLQPPQFFRVTRTPPSGPVKGEGPFRQPERPFVLAGSEKNFFLPGRGRPGAADLLGLDGRLLVGSFLLLGLLLGRLLRRRLLLGRGGLLRLDRRGGRVGVLLPEPIDAPLRVEQLLLPGKERMAIAADIQVQVAVGGPRLPRCPTRTVHLGGG